MKTYKYSGLNTFEILKTAQRAIGTALLHHKAIGNEIVFWKNGKIIREKFTEPLFDVPGIKTKATTKDILEAVKTSRKR